LLGDEGGTGGALNGCAKGDGLVFLVCCHCDVGEGGEAWRGETVLFHTGNDGNGDGDGDGTGVFGDSLVREALCTSLGAGRLYTSRRSVNAGVAWAADLLCRREDGRHDGFKRALASRREDGKERRGRK
jgi:hypothetical protein